MSVYIAIFVDVLFQYIYIYTRNANLHHVVLLLTKKILLVMKISIAKNCTFSDEIFFVTSVLFLSLKGDVRSANPQLLYFRITAIYIYIYTHTLYVYVAKFNYEFQQTQ